MPANAITVEWGGSEHKAIPIHVAGEQEHWNTYLLEDGTSLRIKTMLISVHRVEGAYSPDGNPVYITRTQNVPVVDAPAELRRQP